MSRRLLKSPVSFKAKATKSENYDCREGAKHVLSEVEGDAKYKQICKFETRNPKFETISNSQKHKVQNNGFAVKREPENIHRGGTEGTEKRK
jgi:hypothetical protein